MRKNVYEWVGPILIALAYFITQEGLAITSSKDKCVLVGGVLFVYLVGFIDGKVKRK